MSDFHGKVAVVTGGSNGIGAAVADLLHAAGADVVVLDREPLSHANYGYVEVDLADAAAVTKAAERVLNDKRRVDVLVNVAGICPVNLLKDFDISLYERTLAVNLRAPLLLMKLFGAGMTERGYGRIVNMTSVHGRFSEPGAIAYDASKGGLEAVTRTAALEFAERGVLVNAVAPGFVNTRMSIVEGKNELESDWFKNFYEGEGRLPIRRPAQPVEMAQVVLWLASAENSYVTGQVITADGGLTIRF